MRSDPFRTYLKRGVNTGTQHWPHVIGSLRTDVNTRSKHSVRFSFKVEFPFKLIHIPERGGGVCVDSLLTTHTHTHTHTHSHTHTHTHTQHTHTHTHTDRARCCQCEGREGGEQETAPHSNEFRTFSFPLEQCID